MGDEEVSTETSFGEQPDELENDTEMVVEHEMNGEEEEEHSLFFCYSNFFFSFGREWR